MPARSALPPSITDQDRTGRVQAPLARHLTGPVGRTHPRPLDADPTPAHGNRPALTTVAQSCALGVVSAARPAHRGHLGLHQGGHHLQARVDREAE